MRIAKDVPAKDLAERMGIQPSGVSAIEGRRIVTSRARDRYVAALATFTTSEATSAGVAS